MRVNLQNIGRVKTQFGLQKHKLYRCLQTCSQYLCCAVLVQTLVKGKVGFGVRAYVTYVPLFKESG
jgi:hypothetical protein